jgi:hypothetical protein
MSNKNVSVEFVGDQVIITKHADTEEARETVEALVRAIKNDGEYTPGAYADHADAEDDQGGEDDEEEAELTPRQRRAAEHRRELEALARAGVPPPGTTTTRKARTMTMDDLTGIVSNICKRADGKTVAKLAAYEVGQGGSRFSSFERASMIGSVAKAAGGTGSDDQKFSRFLQDPGNTLLRQWALLPADVGELAKRSTLFDDVIAKAAPLTGERALATQTQSPGKVDPLRERIIRDKAVGSPFLSQEQLARYADEMMEHLNGLARGKQERSRPGGGTLENV